MAQLVVRNLNDIVKAGLRARALQHGHSMEEEVRDILTAAAGEDHGSPKKLGTWFADVFKGQGLKQPIKEQRGFPLNPIEFK